MSAKPLKPTQVRIILAQKQPMRQPIAVIEHPLNAVAQVNHIEIQKQTDRLICESQIREELRLVDRQN